MSTALHNICIDRYSLCIHWNISVILYDKWYFALFFVSYICLTCIDIYLYILVCYQSNFWEKYWVSDILHDIAVVYCWSTSVCQVALSSDVLDNFFPISTGTCIHLYPPPLYIQMMYILKCCMLQFCDIALKFFYICFNIFFIHSNSYFLLNGVFLYICCCIFSHCNSSSGKILLLCKAVHI